MNNDENGDPAKVSTEELLRFLDSRQHILGRRKSLVLVRESSEAEASPSDCPHAHSYLQLVTGATESGYAEMLLTHAATCAACGEVLTKSLNALEGNPSSEEIAAIAELAVARREWHEPMARKLSETAHRKSPGFLRFGRGAAVASVAAGLLLAAGLVVWQMQINSPEHQLAMAYEQSRTLELWLPLAGYAALTSGGRTRGTLADREPAALLDARARLARELVRAPQNPHWLQLQARADVLEERYDSATDVLDRLVAQAPATSDLLTDAASAYYQRGLVSGSELDRSTALDYLRRADELTPTDPVVLFNEAIVMEDRGQMMNAVEVWNRYMTVEHDANWAAEGKRKLAALEQTLNRLKSHQSRIDKMLATPESMDALAGDAKKLASLDEELSSYELPGLLQTAFPSADGQAKQSAGIEGPTSSNSQQARGSPCSLSCLAARRLLKAIAHSLELQHHDYWLTDLFSLRIDSLSVQNANTYGQALWLLGQAIREDQTGAPAVGGQMAGRAQKLFKRLQVRGVSDPSLTTSAQAGEERIAVEYLFSLQRQLDFRGCRSFERKLPAGPQAGRNGNPYPWITGQALATEQVCWDDMPQSPGAGQAFAMKALHVAETSRYPLLTSRINLTLSYDALDSGDEETGERLVLGTLRKLYSGDVPPIRIANTIGALVEIDQDTPLARTDEATLRECVSWLELARSPTSAASARMDLALAETRLGAREEAENQLSHAYEDGGPTAFGGAGGANLAQEEIYLASTMLEQGNLSGAKTHLDRAGIDFKNETDNWLLRQYAADRGMLELASGHFDQAASILESNIRNSEGGVARRDLPTETAEFAQLDHDLYAELAATWLAQGRTPESVLALWERFRLRSRGLPITQCRGGTLDCDQPRLLAAQRQLGGSILTGQIVLLDRVLVYHVDNARVTWSQQRLRRQDIVDAARTLERAVSSPFTSMETATGLGAKLSDALLPALPGKLSPDASLLLEPDPMLRNLSWAVLPTASGPLGVQYPLAETRSILAISGEREESRFNLGFADGKHGLVVGASIATQDEPPLPETLKEAESVNALLSSSTLLLGDQATATNVAEALHSATIFHFAGHAVQTRDGTELLLAAASPGEERPWVDGAFLRKHPPLVCRLAVLSACATGAREASWNHSLQDIVETLGSLGVPEVVATRWQIDSAASVPFMDAFYGSLARGSSAVVALTSARRVQFAQSLYKNPYYWAAYYVTRGETTREARDTHAHS